MFAVTLTDGIPLHICVNNMRKHTVTYLFYIFSEFGDDKFAVLIDHFAPALVNTVEAVFEWTAMKAALYSR